MDKIEVWPSFTWWWPFLMVAEFSLRFKSFCGKSYQAFTDEIGKKVRARQAKFFFVTNAHDRRIVYGGAAVTLQGETLHFHFYWSCVDDNVDENVLKKTLEAIVEHYAAQRISFATFPIHKEWNDGRWDQYAKPVPDPSGRPLVWFTFKFSDLLSFSEVLPEPPACKKAA